MKLPNFLVSGDLIRLKSSMGIPRNKLGDLRAIEIRRGGPNPEELRQLSEEGVEVPKEEVIPLPDGTLSHKDRRVLIYIRDVSSYGGKHYEPRFMLLTARPSDRCEKICGSGDSVIADHETGIFELHYINTGHSARKTLNVCQNCLECLNYKDFQRKMRQKGGRMKAVQNFSIAEFFVAYPKSLHHSMPNHTNQTAPTNDYSPDFSLISRGYRQKRNWICETCGISLEGRAEAILTRASRQRAQEREPRREFESRLRLLSRSGAIARSRQSNAPISRVRGDVAEVAKEWRCSLKDLARGISTSSGRRIAPIECDNAERPLSPRSRAT